MRIELYLNVDHKRMLKFCSTKWKYKRKKKRERKKVDGKRYIVAGWLLVIWCQSWHIDPLADLLLYTIKCIKRRLTSSCPLLGRRCIEQYEIVCIRWMQGVFNLFLLWEHLRVWRLEKVFHWLPGWCRLAAIQLFRPQNFPPPSKYKLPLLRTCHILFIRPQSADCISRIHIHQPRSQLTFFTTLVKTIIYLICDQFIISRLKIIWPFLLGTTR